MQEFSLMLKDMNSIYKFVQGIFKIEADMDIVTTDHRYTVNAKSIMGILSLDTTKPLILRVYNDENLVKEAVWNVLKEL